MPAVVFIVGPLGLTTVSFAMRLDLFLFFLAQVLVFAVFTVLL